jgi:hypothetical protein
MPAMQTIAKEILANNDDNGIMQKLLSRRLDASK